jgi:hypothetical protein
MIPEFWQVAGYATIANPTVSLPSTVVLGAQWILHRAGHESEFLQARKSSALADFGSSYEKMAQLKPFSADTGTLYSLAASVLVPALPVILAEIPLMVVLKDLFSALR